MESSRTATSEWMHIAQCQWVMPRGEAPWLCCAEREQKGREKKSQRL